jgi:hypothetical protein
MFVEFHLFVGRMPISIQRQTILSFREKSDGSVELQVMNFGGKPETINVVESYEGVKELVA